MDKLEKVLCKLGAEDKERIKEILNQLKSFNFTGLHIVKFKGKENIFCVRKGNFRIIYCLKKQQIFILKIQKRKESTYKNL